MQNRQTIAESRENAEVPCPRQKRGEKQAGGWLANRSEPSSSISLCFGISSGWEKKKKGKKNLTSPVQHALIAMCITHERGNPGGQQQHDELHHLYCFQEKIPAVGEQEGGRYIPL